ncbi:MAG: hypothetical protein ACR2RE_04045, partial [Geminicoccaceae bacterium]
GRWPQVGAKKHASKKGRLMVTNAATSFPESKTFAFSIFDDTDNGTVKNLTPVYRLLDECNIKTTKSVWVYPPRGSFTGQCLLDDDYAAYILGLQERGFEIGLHNVGDGPFSREEIIEGLEIFKKVLGAYPRVHTNHVSNPDNIYGGSKRFSFPMNCFFNLLSKIHRGGEAPRSFGDEPGSAHFWGDLAKQYLTYQRALTFNSINTLDCDPKMPYVVNSRSDYANFWFSSSDAHTIDEALHLLSKDNLDRLEASGGACIVYTHFASGFIGDDGDVVPAFRERIEDLASRNGWFVPVSPLLDHLRKINGAEKDPGYLYRLQMDMRWLAERMVKRFRFGH